MWNQIIYYGIQFTLKIWSLCVEIAPFLMIGMLISGMIAMFIDSRLILKHIGLKNLSSILKSTILGIPIPLCSCGVIPVAATLRESGASKGATVSFLVSTPQTGVDSIFLTYGMLGPIFALFRPLAAFISGLISGIIINKFDDDKHFHLIEKTKKTKNKKPFINRLKSGFKYGFISLPSDIVVPLFQGLIIAATIAIFIPADFVPQYFSSNQYIMLFMMLLVSLPIYVCATASIPIAVALMSKGVTAGAVFVFLMAGPATNASSIIVVKNILGEKTMYQYIFLISCTAIIFGFILDTFIPIMNPKIMNSLHIHSNDNYFSILLTILFILILIYSFISGKRNSSIKKDTIDKINIENQSNILSFGVDGMTCSHCKESVMNAVYSFSGVEDVSINLQSGQVDVIGNNLNESLIKDKIKNRGFTLR